MVLTSESTRGVLLEVEPETLNALRDCEARIENAMADASSALRTIRDDGLFKAEKFTSFEDYCDKRWNYSRARAYQLIDHANIRDRFETDGVGFLPASEGLTRPLQKLRRVSKTDDDFFQKCELAWDFATEHAKKVQDVPQVTAQHVESAMSHLGLYRNKQPKAASHWPDVKQAAVRFREAIKRTKLTGAEFAAVHEQALENDDLRLVAAWLNDLIGESG